MNTTLEIGQCFSINFRDSYYTDWSAFAKRSHLCEHLSPWRVAHRPTKCGDEGL